MNRISRVRALWLLVALTLLVLLMLWSVSVDDESEPAFSVTSEGDGAPSRVLHASDPEAFQLALHEARSGDVIVLSAGTIYEGPFVLPPRPAGASWITIRGDQADRLPPPGTRVGPADREWMPVLTARSGAVIRSAPGAHHYVFSGIAMGVLSDEAVNSMTVMDLTSYGRELEESPHHIIIERSCLFGHPRIGTRRGVAMNGRSITVRDSRLVGFKSPDVDAQAIAGWEGSGPFRILNNHLEASGENIMFGGADPRWAGLVPADIEIRGNRFTKPLQWRRDADSWSVKNLFELKNAKHVLVDGNVFEHNWPDSQNGFSILFTVRNQDGGAPWSVVEDVTFSNNVVRNVARGINFLGTDDIHSSGRTSGITIENNLFHDVGAPWGDGLLFQLLDGTDDVRVIDNLAWHDGDVLFLEGEAHTGFVFRGNVVRHNRHGVIGTGTAAGPATVERYLEDPVITGNLVVGGEADLWPPENRFAKPEELRDTAEGEPEDPAWLRDRTADGAGVDFSRLCSALSVRDSTRYCPAVQAVP